MVNLTIFASQKVSTYFRTRQKKTTMKRITLSISMTLIVLTSFGQTYFSLDFDSPLYSWSYCKVFRDTVSNPNCIWQVGHPNKTFFDSAHSAPNVIVTDTVNSIPPNDTSTFYVIHAITFPGPRVLGLHFWYQINGGSTDRGIVEFSGDSAHVVWINLLTQDTAYNFQWNYGVPKPTLTGSEVGWKRFDLNLSTGQLGFYNSNYGDTLLFRFTYITDSINTPHDGWMIDDIYVEDWIEGVPEIQNDNLISVYPNPATDHLTIQRTKSDNKQTIQIINYLGQILDENQNFNGETIDTRQLENGVYLLKYSDTKSFSIKKIAYLL